MCVCGLFLDQLLFFSSRSIKCIMLQAAGSLPISNAAAGPRAGVLWTPALVVKQGTVVAP